MSEPSEDEINKCIAEFMEWTRLFRHDRPGDGYVWNDEEGFERELNFTTSLDALVPVVEKLDKRNLFLTRGRKGQTWWNAYVGNENLTFSWSIDLESPSRALAKAIYHVLKGSEPWVTTKENK